MSIWIQEGEKLAKSLEGVEEKSKIMGLCEEVVEKIATHYAKPSSRKNPLSEVRKAIAAKYPASPSQQASYQYFTSSGKGNKARWEHLALKYLTLSDRDWDELRSDNRVESKAEEKVIPSPKTTEIEQKTDSQGSLEDMTIKQLNLDTENEQTLQEALAQSGTPLADFIRQAIKIYAKTVTGKKRKYGEDLAIVPTEKLLDDAAYSTHPGRAEELVKRAIRAIKTYNDEIATEPSQRWIITQSILTELTRSRASTVQEIMKQYLGDIDRHHEKYSEFFNEDGTLNKYHNRKRGIEVSKVIDLAKLIPSGIDE